MAEVVPFIIKAGWLIDGSGEAAVSEAWIEVEAGRIVAVGRGRPPAGPEHEIIDLADCTLLPGLIDAHVHLALSGSADPELRKSQLGCGFCRAGQLISSHVKAQLAGGVVAVRDGGDAGGGFGPDYPGHVLRHRVERDSAPLRIKSPGRAWHAAGRYGRLIGREPRPGQTLPEALVEFLAATETPPDHVKIVQSGINSLTEFGKETPPQFSLGELAEAAAAAHERGLKVMVHANGREPVRLALKAGADSIEHGFFMGRANLESMAETGTAWAPTAVTMAAYAAELDDGDPRAEVARRILADQLEQLALARELGVKIVAGTDCGSLGVNHGRALAEELGLYLAAGFSAEAAIHSAADRAARLLGLEDELGRIAPGRAACLVAVLGRPADLAEALKRPAAIWIDGRRER